MGPLNNILSSISQYWKPSQTPLGAAPTRAEERTPPAAITLTARERLAMREEKAHAARERAWQRCCNILSSAPQYWEPSQTSLDIVLPRTKKPIFTVVSWSEHVALCREEANEKTERICRERLEREEREDQAARERGETPPTRIRWTDKKE